MRVEYQHFYTENKEPRVTVCYQRSATQATVAVGIAVCSWRDRPNKEFGKYIAYGRALIAWWGEPQRVHPCGRSVERVLCSVDMAYQDRMFLMAEAVGLSFRVKNPQWSLTRDRSHFFPRIVCLCGSTRFANEFVRQNLAETLKGRIVLSIGCNTSDDEVFAALSDEKRRETKAKLDELHKRKIDMATEILVLDVDGYIGASTCSEIAYAQRCGKRVRYLSVEQGRKNGIHIL
jgi:Holliday junction resolvase RusA-like endonuclease